MSQLNSISSPIKTITICSLIRNRDWILPQFLSCIQSLDYNKSSIDLLFIVNDSTDNSHSMLKDFKQSNLHLYNRIIIEEYNRSVPDDSRENKIRSTHIYNHLSVLRNFALSKAKTDYFMFIDSDILFPDYTLSQLLSHNKEAISALIYNGYLVNPDKPYLHPNIMKINQTVKLGSHSNNQYYHISNSYIKNAPHEKQKKLLDVDLTGAIFLFNRDIYKKCKFGYHSSGEDAKFCEDIKSKGYKIYCDTGIFCKHIMNKNMLNNIN